MGKLILWNTVTLDGLFDGARPWDLPWHARVWGEELERFSIEQLRSADALVFGRVTFEGMAAHWRSADGEVAEHMNRLPKVVASRTLGRVAWANSTVVDDAVAAVGDLKRASARDVLVFGSANLSASLIDAGLFDEVRLGVAPVVHGQGRPLFAPRHRPLPLDLVDARTLSTGCVILTYRPAEG